MTCILLLHLFFGKFSIMLVPTLSVAFPCPSLSFMTTYLLVSSDGCFVSCSTSVCLLCHTSTHNKVLFLPFQTVTFLSLFSSLYLLLKKRGACKVDVIFLSFSSSTPFPPISFTTHDFPFILIPPADFLPSANIRRVGQCLTTRRGDGEWICMSHEIRETDLYIKNVLLHWIISCSNI